MKIAILTELFPPSVGGQEIRFAEISQVLARRGHSVRIFCIQNIPGTQQEEVLEGVAIHRYPEAFGYQQPSLRWLRRKPYAVLKYALWCRQIDPSAFDFFIFNQWPLAHIWLAQSSIREKAVIDWCEFRHGPLFHFIQKVLPRRVAGNMANSIPLKDRLEEMSGRSFECIPSGIHANRYSCAPGAQRSGVVYLGRIEEHKNLPLVLSSFELMIAKGYSGRLRIAGNGPALPQLQRLAEKSKVADRIDLMGFISEDQKIGLLATSEILMMTSRREGSPRVVAEAMASGLPVVTADYPENGAKEVVRQYGIGQVTKAAPEQLAVGALAVIADWDRYSKACLVHSRSLDWELVVDKLLHTAGALPRAS